MIGLSKKQKEVLDFIKQFIDKQGFSPSYQEIGDHFQFSSIGTVYNHIKVLKRKGALSSESHARRSFSVVNQQELPKTMATVELPFMGYIEADEPIDTFSQIQTITVPASLVPSPDQTYAFRVRGDSMKAELIADGDLIFVEAGSSPVAGSVVLGVIHSNRLFVRNYYPEGSYIRLESQSKEEEAIISRVEEVTIQGAVVGLVRFY